MRVNVWEEGEAEGETLHPGDQGFDGGMDAAGIL